MAGLRVVVGFGGGEGVKNNLFVMFSVVTLVQIRLV